MPRNCTNAHTSTHVDWDVGLGRGACGTESGAWGMGYGVLGVVPAIMRIVFNVHLNFGRTSDATESNPGHL